MRGTLQIYEKHSSKKADKSQEHLLSLSSQLKDIVEVLIDNLVDPDLSSDFVSEHVLLRCLQHLIVLSWVTEARPLHQDRLYLTCAGTFDT